MAEKEKRRATTFRTSKGTIVNVQYPDIYVSPAFLSTEDVTNPTELREALREELGWEYIAHQNFAYHPNRNAQFTLRTYNSFVTPREVKPWVDVNEALHRVTDPADPNYHRYYLVYVDEASALYSKRAFKYGAFGFQVRLPNPTDSAFRTLHLGAETVAAYAGGITNFVFDIQAGAIRTQLSNYSINAANGSIANVSALLPITPSAGAYKYLVKVNRASVEYWVEGSLISIVQFSPESDSYAVRITAPYRLEQVKGQTPCFQPALMEYTCSAAGHIGTRSNILLWSIYVIDGDPAPPRTLHPITGGVNWEGTAIAAGTLTSDRIPILGYDRKTIVFLADQAGTLYIDVDYGDNSNDQYDSVAVAANTLSSYIMTADPLWLRLRFTPTTYPCTVTRARVLMN